MELLDPWFAEKFTQRRHERVFSTLDTLRNQQQERLKMLEIYRLLYSDDDCNGYSTPVTAATRTMRAERSRFSENLIRSVVDSVCAKIGKNSPKPFCVSNGGDGALRRKGKNLNKFLLGKFDHCSVSNRLRSALRDAAVVGTGALKILVDYQTKDLSLERTDVAKLFVELSECQFGQQPTQMFQVIPGNKRLLMELYPKQAQAIKSAAPPSYLTLAQRKPKPVLVEQVELVEAWKKSDEPGKPGRHVICCSNATLCDEEWEEDDFPFVFIRYNESDSFWGTGLASLLMEVQYRVNYTLLQIQENIRLCGKPTILIPQAANVTQSHIRNVIGNQIIYKGATPPTVYTPQTTHPEVFQWLNDQRQRAYEIAGISQLSATSQKPAGELSGVALESLNDIESERFIMFGKAYEQASLDVAERLITITKEEYDKHDPDVDAVMFKSTFSRSWELSEIRWSEVNMRRDQYNLSVFPVSSLPQSVSGRQQMIQDYMQQGMIPADVGRELLDFPDYQRWADLQAAGHDNAERLVEDVVFEGKDHVVEKYHDAAYMLTYCQNLYNQQQLIDADEERLERLRDLMDQCQEFLDTAQQAAQPPAPGPSAPPTPAPQPQGVAA